MNVYDTIHRFGPLRSAEENTGLQTVCNIINNISKGNNTELKRNNEEEELKKDEIVHSEAIPGYQEDKSIEEIIIGNKNSEQKQSSNKLATIKQTLDVLSLKSQNTDSADFVLNTNNKSRKKQKSENTINETTYNFPPQDSYLLSQHTQPKNVKKKKKKKLKSSMTHSNKAENSVQSLPGPCSLSKQPPHIEATKTNLKKAVCLPAVPVPNQSPSPVSTPTTKEKNTAVKLLSKQGHPKRDEVAVQSLPGPCSLSKQPPHIEATKTNLKKAVCLPAVPVPNQSPSPVSTPTTKEKNTAVKLLSKQGHPNRDEVAVQSLPGPCSLSKQPPHIEEPKTHFNKAASVSAVSVPNQSASPVSTPTTKEKNTAVKLLSKQGHPKRDEVAVQSLPGPCSLSKQPPHIEATKTNLKKAVCLPAVPVPNQSPSPVSTPTTKEKNTAVKLLSKQGHPKRDEVAVQSLPGPCSLSKQPPHIEEPKTHFNKAASVSAVSVPNQSASPVSTPTTKEKNTAVKLLSKQGHPKRDEVAVQSLPGPCSLSKQPPHIEATKTNLKKAVCLPAVPVPNQSPSPVSTPTTKEKNTAVKLLSKQGHPNRDEVAVQSLPGPCSLSKQPPHIEEPKTHFNKAASVSAVSVPNQSASPVSTPTTKEKNTAVKLLSKQGHPKRDEVAVQSLPGPCSLSKQPPHIEATKTNLKKAVCLPAVPVPNQSPSPVSTPTTKEKNTAVKLLSKQGHPKRDEVAVQSLPGPCSLSKQPPHIEEPKTHFNKAASVSAVSVPNQSASPVSTPTTKEKNTAVKLLSKQGHPKRDEVAVQSLPGPCSLSKQPPHIEATKTNLKKAVCLPAVPVPNQSPSPVSTPTTKEKNTAVKLLSKQGHPKRDEVAVQSLPGPCSLSKQPPHIEEPKTHFNKAASVSAVSVPNQSASPVSTPTTKEKNTAVKLLSKQGHPKRDEVAVQSLPGPCSLSKQPPHIEATKTNLKKAVCLPAVPVPNQSPSPVSTPTTKEKNTAVKLLSKQGHPNRDEVAVQSLPGPCSLSKQPPHIEEPKTHFNKAASVSAVSVPNQSASPVSTPTTKEKNTAVKLLSKQGHPKRDEVAVQSLPGPCSLSKQPPHIEATKTNLKKAVCLPAVPVPNQSPSPVSTPTTKEKNTAVKLLSKQGHPKRDEVAVQSLPGPCSLSKQPPHIEAPKTHFNKAASVSAVSVPKQRASPVSTPTTKEKNTAVKLLSKQGHPNRDEVAVQSLPGPRSLSKQPPHMEAPKTHLNKAASVPAVAVPKQRAFPVLTPTRIVYNTKVKLLCKQGHSNKGEDSVQSLLGSTALSKRPSYIEAPKTHLNKAASVPAPAVPQQRGSPVSILTTLPKPVEYNHKEVILFVKQAWQDFEKEKINGRFNILEYKRE